MKFKLKNGSEVDLHEDDVKAISQMHENNFDADEMIKYFEDVHKHAISKLENISEQIITDENSLDQAAENVMKYGTYMDVVKFMRYARDYDISYHILESFKE